MKKQEIQFGLQELYNIDKSLEKHSQEIQSWISDFVQAKPKSTFTNSFKNNLAQQIAKKSKQMKQLDALKKEMNKKQNPFFKILFGLGFSALAGLIIFIDFYPTQPNPELMMFAEESMIQEESFQNMRMMKSMAVPEMESFEGEESEMMMAMDAANDGMIVDDESMEMEITTMALEAKKESILEKIKNTCYLFIQSAYKYLEDLF